MPDTPQGTRAARHAAGVIPAWSAAAVRARHGIPVASSSSFRRRRAWIGEQIVYPEGHFCQRAMTRLDTIIVTDMTEDTGDRYPPPSAPVHGSSQGGGNHIGPRRASLSVLGRRAD
jgi:hypothetical protein